MVKILYENWTRFLIRHELMVKCTASPGPTQRSRPSLHKPCTPSPAVLPRLHAKKPQEALLRSSGHWPPPYTPTNLEREIGRWDARRPRTAPRWPTCPRHRSARRWTRRRWCRASTCSRSQGTHSSGTDSDTEPSADRRFSPSEEVTTGKLNTTPEE